MAARSSGEDHSMNTVVKALKMYISPIPNMIITVGEEAELCLESKMMASMGSMENTNARITVGVLLTTDRPIVTARVAPNDAPDDTPVV